MPIEKSHFVDNPNEPMKISSRKGMIKEGEIHALEATVAAVNELADKLGFTLEMAPTQSEHTGYLDVIFYPSQPVHRDFFHTLGVLWSTYNSVGLGNNIAGNVPAEDIQSILLAEMTGTNTMQCIDDELQHSSALAATTRWQNIMTAISNSASVY